MSSRLTSEEVLKVAFAAKRFSASHELWFWDRDNHTHRVDALAWLSTLESCIDEMVSRETSKVEAILDGTQGEEPPF